MAFHSSVKIYCKAGANFSVTVRDDKVVLAQANPADEYQHWYKYENPNKKDEEGLSSFALVNKITGLAIKHAAASRQPVQLARYDAKFLDESILWTQKELENGYSTIRMLNNVNLILNASGGYAYDGVPIIAYPWSNGYANEMWKVEQYSTIKLYCKAGVDFSMTTRDGEVVLAKSNPTDELQHWYKFENAEKKDEEGLSSFALVNKKTGLAIKHATGSSQPVQLVCYDVKFLDESILWTQRELENGYSTIRMLNNVHLILNASGGYAYDGVPIIAYPWSNGYANEIWKVEQYSTIKLYCKAGVDFNMTVRDGEVVLAKSDPTDELQHWYKFENADKKDEEGLSSFALVNKKTGLAIKHATGSSQPVQLVCYDVKFLDESILWTQKELENGYSTIRMLNNVRLILNASGGYAYDGVPIIAYPWSNGYANEMWKVEQYLPSVLPVQSKTVKIFCKAGPDFSFTIRDSKVVLAPTNKGDGLQHWYKYEDHASSFVFVNKITGQALKNGGSNKPLQLVQYKTTTVDESVLWIDGEDFDGYKRITPKTDAAIGMDATGGHVKDGVVIQLYPWGGFGANAVWKIQSWD